MYDKLLEKDYRMKQKEQEYAKKSFNEMYKYCDKYSEVELIADSYFVMIK